MTLSILVSLGALAVAGLGLAVAAINVRRADLAHVEQKAQWAATRTEALERKVDVLETKLTECEAGRIELRAENLKLFQRIDALERKTDT